MNKQDVLVIGKQGQLATALRRHDVIAGHKIVAIGRPELDLLTPETVKNAIANIKPALVINAAAYTAVDKAESEEDIAIAINTTAVGLLGRICAQQNIPMIHISTDYVFSGEGSKPYKPDDRIAPQGIYGSSKSQGEIELRAANKQHLIFRTAWVFGEHGNNFLKTMIRLSETHEHLRVVADQRGTPTYAGDLAEAVIKIAEQVLTTPQNIKWGTYHLTNSGETTWHGFAKEIFKCLDEHGVAIPDVSAISTEEYPTPAKRPAYSVLDCRSTVDVFGVILPDWKNATKRCVKNIEGKYQ